MAGDHTGHRGKATLAPPGEWPARAARDGEAGDAICPEDEFHRPILLSIENPGAGITPAFQRASTRPAAGDTAAGDHQVPVMSGDTGFYPPRTRTHGAGLPSQDGDVAGQHPTRQAAQQFTFRIRVQVTAQEHRACAHRHAQRAMTLSRSRGQQIESHSVPCEPPVHTARRRQRTARKTTADDHLVHAAFHG
jgi:hypothetical protein